MLFVRSLTIAATLVAALPAAAQDLDSSSAWKASSAGEAVLIDIRTAEEWRQSGTPPAALRIDFQGPDFAIQAAAVARAHPGKEVHLICRSGRRSAAAIEMLGRMGITNARSVAGGVQGQDGWVAQGLPLQLCGDCAPDRP
ncbi:MAG TPA: rhodanese-like domain-containing protein [Azospirillaceae bacterium]|nr:rhodanese-like domain-containing protein [Azospirillaceae bacterium]